MWMLVGCGLLSWSPDETAPERDELTEQLRDAAMRNHQVALHRARDAVIAQDLVGVRRAGERLATEHHVPRLPQAALDNLDEVRRGGAALAAAADLDEAASTLVELTELCARCHTMLEVPPEVPPQATHRDVLWTALVFRSEEHWEAVAHDEPSLQGLRYWDERRLAVTVRLQGGVF